jgi:hypothetical protein
VKLTCFRRHEATLVVIFLKKKQILRILNAHHSISIFFKSVSIKTLPLHQRNTLLFLFHITQLHLQFISNKSLNIHQSKTYLFLMTRNNFMVVWSHGAITRCITLKKYSVCGAVDKKKIMTQLRWWDVEMFLQVHFSATKNNEHDTKNFNSNLMLAQNFKQKLNVRLKSQTGRVHIKKQVTTQC